MVSLLNETMNYPFAAFNFSVEIQTSLLSNLICNAAFSECDGLDMTMNVKTIHEGGNNGQAIHLAGSLTYGPLTLKRGMTFNYDLWRWFDAVMQNPGLRASAAVVIYSQSGGVGIEQARFTLSRCMPIKLKAPTLNAKDGQIAIEEMQIAYESLRLGSGLSINLNVNAGINI
jgi:phage tail-like protein